MEYDSQVFKMTSSFLRDICKSFPEAKSSIYRNYEDIIVYKSTDKINDFPHLQEFLKIIHEHKDLISQRNHLFFLNDTPLLKDLSLKRVWESSISDNTRNTLWKYLETFSILNISIHSNNELQKALESLHNDEEVHIKDKQTAKDLQELKQLTESVTQEAKEEKKDDDDMGNLFENMGDMMGDLSGLMNSNIGSIAKEIAESSDIQDLFSNVDDNSNPMDIMQKLMSGDGMGKIFSNINETIDKKVKSGELSESSLKNEAESMCKNTGIFNAMNQSQDSKSSDRKDKKQ